MIDLGFYALLASLVTCLWGLFAGVLGGRLENLALIRSAGRSVHANFLLLSIASISLSGLILTDRFSVRYVASYSSKEMPLLYKFSAFWAGQEGSLLFWALCISLFALTAVVFSRHRSPRMQSYFSAFLLGIMAFFSLLILLTGNPFALLERQVLDGQGLNPLLQNWYMVIHPPTLFLGFAGLAVPFAFVLAALADGFRDKSWLRGASAWALASWIFLTIGITLGGRWAYEELGWGGYWAWDPVENASLLPWLVLTGFIHSIILYQWKGSLKIWSFILLIAAFEFTIFGTFITRSGVLSSVHAFGNSSTGPFLVWFMVATTLLAMGMMVYRRRHFRREGANEAFFSRDTSLVVNNWVLSVLTLAILIGTVMPAVSELYAGRKVSVEASFFNQVSWPLGLALLLLIGFCTMLTWKKTPMRSIRALLSVSLAGGLFTGAALLVFGIRHGIALAYFSAAAFVILVIGGRLFRSLRAYGKEQSTGLVGSSWGFLARSNRLVSASLVHAGVVIVMVGIVASSLFTREETFMVREGEVFQMEDYTLTFTGVEEQSDAVKDMLIAKVEVLKDGRSMGVLTPQKHFHRNHEQPMTEIALGQSFSQDLYLMLYGWDGEGSFSFRVIINPLTGFIWWGVALMCLAGTGRLAHIIVNRNRNAVSG